MSSKDEADKAKCPLCHNAVTFTDEEHGYEYCTPCSWRGPIDVLSRLKEEIVEAACEFIDDDCPENREALYIARAALRDFIYEREQGEKK